MMLYAMRNKSTSVQLGVRSKSMANDKQNHHAKSIFCSICALKAKTLILFHVYQEI